MPSKFSIYLMSAIAGILFGLGLAISEMMNPAKVLNFLDIFGHWDPSLGFVMFGGLVVSTLGFLITKKRAKAVNAELHLPTSNNIDAKLIVGAALFGIGWGIAGYCPGPALANIIFGWTEILWFLPAMIGGFYISHLLQKHAR
jgi:uncharacterized protein